MDQDHIAKKIAQLTALRKSLRDVQTNYDQGLLDLGRYARLSTTLRQEQTEILLQLLTAAKASGEYELAELLASATGDEDVATWQRLMQQLTAWAGRAAEFHVPLPPVDTAPQIFLSYARVDAQKVEKLYQQLSSAGFKPWMDIKDILPGEDWQAAIDKALHKADFFLACLSSSSVNKRGIIQKEIKNALDIWQGMLSNDIYLIPVRLEDCAMPDSLRRFQRVDLFQPDGWPRLRKAIQEGMARR